MVLLAFAVQVIVEPEIMIVDEALAVGDALFQRKCYARLEQLINDGMTLLLVTHDTETVKRICQRAVFLKEGEQAFDGDSNEGVLEYLRYLFPLENNTVPIKENLEKEIIYDENQYVYRTDVTDNKNEWGVGGGRVTDINVYGLEAPNILKTPQNITIEVLAEWSIDLVKEYIIKEQLLPNINIGIQLSDSRNINLYGTNTFLEDVMISPYEQSSAKVCFELKLPALFSGDILITAAIVVGNMTNFTNMHFSESASVIHNEAQCNKSGLIYFNTKVRSGVI